MNKRIEWIDFCKALGIYLVVFGHFLPVGTPFKIIIYSFHVPLFFVLSGYLLNTNRSWHQQMLHRVRALLGPYFVFAAISSTYYLVYQANLTEIISKFFYWQGETIWNDPLWFLFTLYITEVIAYTLLRCLPTIHKNMKALSGVVIGIMIIGYFVYWKRPSILIYFGFDRSLCLLGFYLLGYLLKQAQLIEKLLKSKELWAGTFLVNCVLSLILNWNNNISVYHLDLNNYFVFLLTSITGSISLIALCKDIKVNKIIKPISRHTIFIMGTHYVFLLLYNQIATKIPVDPMLFSIPVLALYTVVLYWWDKFHQLT